MKRKWLILLVAIFFLFLGVYIYKRNIASLTETSSENIINSTNGAQIICFERPTCPICKELTPKLRKIAKQKHITIKYVNTDKDPTVVHKYNIKYVPIFIFLKNKKVRFALTDNISLSEVSKFIDRAKHDTPYLWIYN